MENTATILLYVGTILIGSVYVSNMGYLSTILLLPFTRGFKPIFKKLMKPPKRTNKILSALERTALSIVFIFYAILITIWFFITLPFLIIQFFIGMPLLYINNLLNKLLLKSMEPWKDIYFTNIRKRVKDKHTNIEPTDENLWRIAEQNRVPFLALFGVVCATIGFILKLVS
jgi:hypothetical protein